VSNGSNRSRVFRCVDTRRAMVQQCECLLRLRTQVLCELPNIQPVHMGPDFYVCRVAARPLLVWNFIELDSAGHERLEALGLT
jgi:hypothetical protein